MELNLHFFKELT